MKMKKINYEFPKSDIKTEVNKKIITHGDKKKSPICFTSENKKKNSPMIKQIRISLKWRLIEKKMKKTILNGKILLKKEREGGNTRKTLLKLRFI